MSSYAARRLVYAVITFFGITIAVFVLIRAVPGDPVYYFMGGLRPGAAVPQDVLDAVRREHHLDQPLLKQYAIWLRDVATLDFGHSFIDRRPVRSRIAEKLPNTFALNLAALLLALAIALPSGILSGARPNRWFDRGSGAAFFMLYSLPSFWVALLLMQLFAVKLQVLPLYGMVSDGYAQLSGWEKAFDRTQHAILPVVTLAYGQLALFARFSRSAVLEVARRDFIRTARAKGASEARVVFHHALRNALIPLITLLGLMIPYLLSGSVIVERIFEWDGIGRMYFDSILARDYPTVMGLTVVTAIITLFASLAADLLYGAADPRIRVGESR